MYSAIFCVVVLGALLGVAECDFKCFAEKLKNLENDILKLFEEDNPATCQAAKKPFIDSLQQSIDKCSVPVKTDSMSALIDEACDPNSEISKAFKESERCLAENRFNKGIDDLNCQPKSMPKSLSAKEGCLNKMSLGEKDKKTPNRRVPFYEIVDGFRIPGIFTPEAFRSTVAYKPRPDDLFIVTYPKCGTTWVQNIVACIFRNGKPFESAIEFLTQTPFLEMVGAEAASTMKRPGALKVHLPFNLTPWSPEAKYIFVARNPKDCCVSFYHHTENLLSYQFEGGSFDDFFELFIEGQVDFGDYFETTMSWYEHRNDPNVLFITYEELKKDTVNNVLKIAGFMGEKYRDALEKDKKLLDDVIYHSSFAFMKERLNKHYAELSNLPREMIINNPDLPPAMRAVFGGEKPVFKSVPSEVTFVRKGEVGDWKNYFSPEQSARLEKRFKETMGDTELAEIWRDVM